MKKTISLAALTMSAATSSFAIIGPPLDFQSVTYCLDSYTDVQGNKSASDCDQRENNRMTNARTGTNGCTASQVALTTTKLRHEREFPVRIRACLPPNVVQL